MNYFEKLFVNSTNRFSAVKNIILSQSAPSFTPLHPTEYQNALLHPKNGYPNTGCNFPEPTQTFEQLQLKYQQLSKSIKQANKQRQMMTVLIDKIFKIEQGDEDKLKRRFRRKKNELQSKFECNISSCNKIYSSSASLVRHSKLKHAYTKSEPPSHDYQIPPSPNLKPSNDSQDRPEGQETDLQKDGEDSDEDGAAMILQHSEDFYEADCENSQNMSEDIQLDGS